jgi:hypothetical protein
MQPVAEPNQQEDENSVLVLVQKLVQVVLVWALAQKRVQVEVHVQQQQRAVFSSIAQAKQHTAVPNSQVNYCT